MNIPPESISTKYPLSKINPNSKQRSDILVWARSYRTYSELIRGKVEYTGSDFIERLINYAYIREKLRRKIESYVDKMLSCYYNSMEMNFLYKIKKIRGVRKWM